MPRLQTSAGCPPSQTPKGRLSCGGHAENTRFVGQIGPNCARQMMGSAALQSFRYTAKAATGRGPLPSLRHQSDKCRQAPIVMVSSATHVQAAIMQVIQLTVKAAHHAVQFV
jgi:hypothetical protein